jgi:hypothetical protein
MQLVIGLLSGPDGTPVAVRVFEGNTPDSQTVAQQVGILASTFGIEMVTSVGLTRNIDVSREKGNSSYHISIIGQNYG